MCVCVQGRLLSPHREGRRADGRWRRWHNYLRAGGSRGGGVEGGRGAHKGGCLDLDLYVLSKIHVQYVPCASSSLYFAP